MSLKNGRFSEIIESRHFRQQESFIAAAKESVCCEEEKNIVRRLT